MNRRQVLKLLSATPLFPNELETFGSCSDNEYLCRISGNTNEWKPP